jgi:hypothetical protein
MVTAGAPSGYLGRKIRRATVKKPIEWSVSE